MSNLKAPSITIAFKERANTPKDKRKPLYIKRNKISNNLKN